MAFCGFVLGRLTPAFGGKQCVSFCFSKFSPKQPIALPPSLREILEYSSDAIIWMQRRRCALKPPSFP
ncbi:hypothetical protein MLD38_024928 [Melastoma candidum]|uniref:Uncharacterized protein n=1 Tax=Melastoma candidum TaxID=119954 RepID=A0ACB9NWV1_9MYRT|nr:hypothetical protein MLD38_024928 [Melastoma candidum]